MLLSTCIKNIIPPLFSNAMQRHNLTVKSPHHPSCQISIPNFFRYFFLLLCRTITFRFKRCHQNTEMAFFFIQRHSYRPILLKRVFMLFLKKYCWSTSLIRRNTSVDQGVWWVGRGCPKDKFVCRGSASIFANFTILLN